MSKLRRLRGLLYAAVGMGGVLLLVLAVGVRGWIRGSEQRQRLEIPRLWARLAPYPETAKELLATTSGGLFTRAFTVSFSAPAADIERWLEASPGTREAQPSRLSAGKRHFAISPGGGAQHAEVTVNDSTGLVEIYVYWS
jgi:hypothetical protein